MELGGTPGTSTSLQSPKGWAFPTLGKGGGPTQPQGTVRGADNTQGAQGQRTALPMCSGMRGRLLEALIPAKGTTGTFPDPEPSFSQLARRLD